MERPKPNLAHIPSPAQQTTGDINSPQLASSDWQRALQHEYS